MADAKGPAFNPIEDLKILLLFFTVLWLFWFFSGGPARYEETQKPFLRQPTKLGADESYIWRDPNINDQYGEIPSVQIKARLSKQRDSKVTLESPDPRRESSRGYRPFGKPIISLSKGPADSYGMSYLKIDFLISNRAPLNMTGLWVRDIFGKSVTIGQASALPYQGRINEEADILVSPGSTVFLIDGPSPIGVSFRVNKCIGHLAKLQRFYPSLPVYIDDDLTYNACVEVHKADPNFYGNDWRVYVGTKDKIWGETGDIVRLMDSLGNTLASLFY